MSYHTIEDGPWPQGVTVAVYPVASVDVGSPIDVAVAQPDGTATFGGLTEGAQYTAVGSGGTQTFYARNQESALGLVETRVAEVGVSPQMLGSPDPTGVSNSDAAFISLRNHLQDDAFTQAGLKRAPAVGYIPAGYYKITTSDALMSLVTPDAVHSGLTIRGAGREQTFIEFAPTTAAAALFNNVDQFRNLNIQDITFIGNGTGLGATPTLMRSTAVDSGPQNIVWERVNFRGTWGDVLSIEGGVTTDNNSEWSFWHCGVYVTCTTFLHVGAGAGGTAQDQFLNYNFYACQLEPVSGDMVRMDYGGGVRFYGGSWLMSGAAGGRFLYMPNGTHGSGVTHCEVDGVRCEIRNANTKIIDCAWKFGNVIFRNFSTGGQILNITSSQVVATFYGSNDRGPIVTWEDSDLCGSHEYQYDQNTYQSDPRASYKRCLIRQHTDPDTFITHTFTGGGIDRVGGKWQVDFDNCQGLVTYGADGANHPFDSTLNWQSHKSSARARIKVACLVDAYGQLPRSSGTPGQATAKIWLPLNAVLLGVRIIQPAVGGASAGTTWQYQLTDGNAAVIATYAGGTAWNAGFAYDSGRLSRILSSDLGRQLTLTATNTADASITGVCLLEYVGG